MYLGHEGYKGSEDYEPLVHLLSSFLLLQDMVGAEIQLSSRPSNVAPRIIRWLAVTTASSIEQDTLEQPLRGGSFSDRASLNCIGRVQCGER